MAQWTQAAAMPRPDDLQVDGTNDQAAENVRVLLYPFVGRPLNTGELERTLTRLAGEGRYQSVDYGFLSGEGGKTILQIRVLEKTYAPPTLDFAIGV